MRLEGKIAIVTGGASGMGKSASILFAAEGARVAVVDLHEEAAQLTVDEIIGAGGDAIAIGADVSRSTDVANLVARTRSELGLPTVLFNNAGIDPENKLPLVDVPEDIFDQVMAVNLKGPWLGIKHVAPLMIEAGGGSIINTASIGAFVAASTAAYCASKGGVVALTRVAAVELGRFNIRVNALCPGATWTGMAEKQMAELSARGIVVPTEEELAARYSTLGRLGRPIDMAQMALFLASDESAYANGGAFVNDGGMSIMAGVDTYA
jgi:3-oxoacyl-[acyl-carrier protein] reductase